jgi:hypothetical protein
VVVRGAAGAGRSALRSVEGHRPPLLLLPDKISFGGHLPANGVVDAGCLQPGGEFTKQFFFFVTDVPDKLECFTVAKLFGTA